jgi:hypothetical protein
VTFLALTSYTTKDTHVPCSAFSRGGGAGGPVDGGVMMTVLFCLFVWSILENRAKFRSPLTTHQFLAPILYDRTFTIFPH